jgi:branched-chain amino acid transport system substrate-binding protein
MKSITRRVDRSAVTRRRLLELAGASAGLALSHAVPRPAIAAERTIKLGYVSPQTGPLAPFAEADNFTIAAVRAALKDGLQVNGKTHAVEIIVEDSQSNPNRAAEVASDLIVGSEVDIMLVASTPETTNPVSDQCELAEVPCISTVAPWQPWFFPRGGDPAKGFDWTYHFFWGLEDIIAVFTDMWGKLETDKVVGGLFPNDGDGNAWGDPERGFPPALKEKGYSLIDPGRYQNLTDDFSAQISAFKQGKVEIVTGVVIPPDWTTFWTQAKQQGFAPKCASVGKALLFPVAVEALGDAGHNLSSEVWWSPSHPFKSSLTGEAAVEIAKSYSEATKKQWTQPIGFVHALFEVAVDALKRTAEIGDRAAALAAITATKLDTVVGPIAWSGSPVKNVAKTPLVGGQWRLGGSFKYDLVITSNETAPQIPVGGEMQPL